MATTNGYNNADISFKPNAQNKKFENKAKVNFMNAKSQNVVFFNGESSLPHFNFPERDNQENIFGVLDNCPTKKLCFFNEPHESFNNAYNFNSYLFQK